MILKIVNIINAQIFGGRGYKSCISVLIPLILAQIDFL